MTRQILAGLVIGGWLILMLVAFSPTPDENPRTGPATVVRVR